MILGIYGSGGLGREILDLAKTINNSTEEWNEIVFINDFREESVINDIRIFTFEEFKTSFSPDTARIIIAVGEPKIRRALRNKTIENDFKLQSLIHPMAFIGIKTEIGEGSIVQFGSFVSCNVQIGANVLVQPNACIGHDSAIGDDTVISSYVAIAGSCTIGKQVYIGLSVPVKENVSIGTGSIIGMGSVVIRNISENLVAVGNPARPIKNNDSGRVFT